MFTKFPRFLFAIAFAGFGLMHFIFGSDLVPIVPGFLPGGIIWVYFTGAALIAASVSFITEFYIRMASYGIVLFMVVLIAFTQIPFIINGISTGFTFTTFAGLLIDLAIAGGALLLAGQYPPVSEQTGLQS